MTSGIQAPKQKSSNCHKNGPKIPEKYRVFAVIAVTAIAVGNIAVTPIAVFGIPTAM